MDRTWTGFAHFKGFCMMFMEYKTNLTLPATNQPMLISTKQEPEEKRRRPGGTGGNPEENRRRTGGTGGKPEENRRRTGGEPEENRRRTGGNRRRTGGEQEGHRGHKGRPRQPTSEQEGRNHQRTLETLPVTLPFVAFAGFACSLSQFGLIKEGSGRRGCTLALRVRLGPRSGLGVWASGLLAQARTQRPKVLKGNDYVEC